MPTLSWEQMVQKPVFVDGKPGYILLMVPDVQGRALVMHEAGGQSDLISKERITPAQESGLTEFKTAPKETILPRTPPTGPAEFESNLEKTQTYIRSLTENEQDFVRNMDKLNQLKEQDFSYRAPEGIQRRIFKNFFFDTANNRSMVELFDPETKTFEKVSLKELVERFEKSDQQSI